MAEMTKILAHFFFAGQFNGLRESVSSGSQATIISAEGWAVMVARPKGRPKGLQNIFQALLNIKKVFFNVGTAFTKVKDALFDVKLGLDWWKEGVGILELSLLHRTRATDRRLTR
jgi:hypothetical protein